MSTSTLLLLVHLYILNYPYVNNPEYDRDIFNPRVRGLRDRTKAMEDIAYFLVGQIEGGSSKKLPIYPCRRPSESLAFRVSLTKYLEQLRHHSIHPHRTAASPNSSDSAAPWWKDVVVRKSLLEESSGEKFDRLILSLSTYALMKASHTIPKDTMTSRLRSEPVSYTNALVDYQSIRQSWTRSASSLLHRLRDLNLLRETIRSQSTQVVSRYKGLSTPHLTALAHSKYNDVMNSCAEEMRPTLVLFIDLSGVTNSLGTAPSPSSTHTGKCPPLLSQPLPLPIAAAHHPSYLLKFKNPLLQGSKEVRLPVKSLAETVLAARIEVEKRVQQLLATALSRVESRHLELERAVTSNSPQPSSNPASVFLKPFTRTFEITYDPKPVKALLTSVGLGEDFDVLEPDIEIDHELEKRVSNIRTNILPPFPTLSDGLSAPRLQITELASSQLKSIVMRSLESRIPQPRKQSDSKRSTRGTRRQSVRFSTARRLTGRPSIFGASDELDNSINCLINQTHDFATDDEDTNHEGLAFSSPYRTPNARRKTPKVNRIWLPGTPATRIKGFGSRTPKPRASEALALQQLFEGKRPTMELPDSASASFSLSDNSAVLDADERHKNESADEDEEEDYLPNDPPSMTLKEILLSADTSRFELLAEAEEDSLGSGFLENEVSFSWE